MDHGSQLYKLYVQLLSSAQGEAGTLLETAVWHTSEPGPMALARGLEGSCVPSVMYEEMAVHVKGPRVFGQ